VKRAAARRRHRGSATSLIRKRQAPRRAGRFVLVHHHSRPRKPARQSEKSVTGLRGLTDRIAIASRTAAVALNSRLTPAAGHVVQTLRVLRAHRRPPGRVCFQCPSAMPDAKPPPPRRPITSALVMPSLQPVRRFPTRRCLGLHDQRLVHRAGSRQPCFFRQPGAMRPCRLSRGQHRNQPSRT